MKPRILFYVQHLLGVGHVKRAAAIAKASCDYVDMHVVLGGAPVALADFGDATIHQLPSARAQDMSFAVLLDEAGQPVDDAWRASRKSALLAIARRVDPQVLLVEHFPFGRRKFDFELLPLFQQLRQKPEARILASVRDVLVEKDDPARTDKIVGLVRRWFDGILVHGDRSVVAFDATFPAAVAIEDLIEYTGYVVDNASARATPGARSDDAEVVVSIGGGAVGQNLLAAAVDAANAGALGNRHWRLLAGANLPDHVFQSLRDSAAGSSRITVERARPDFSALLSRAGLSISQAGYNTVMDVLIAGCPALVVPFAAAAESEQAFRARELERRGLLTVLDESRLSAASLAVSAATALATPLAAHAINLDGARGTATALARWAEAA